MYVGDYSPETNMAFLCMMSHLSWNFVRYAEFSCLLLVLLFRGGYKLEAAIEQLSVDVNGKVALDSGLSTGGFTDCLLQYGASFVYGVDVGYGQVGLWHIFLQSFPVFFACPKIQHLLCLCILF